MDKKNNTKYILKNKNNNVLSFSSVEDGTKTILHSIKILNEDLLPLTISVDDINKTLTSWIRKRKIPKGRQFARNILLGLGKYDKSLLGYIDVSFGLSLNDAYWIVPADKNYKWEDYNLYHNEFDTALQLAAFGQRISYRKKSSPEYTTNGMLKKCWYRDNDGQIYLYKGSMQGNQALAEYYNYQIAEVMKFNAVPYDVIEYSNQIVSVCPLFTCEDEGYVPMEMFIPHELDERSSDFEPLCSKIFGQEAFEDMMVFDALICNIDRHPGNFGMIISNDTNEILRPAPIFDNGMGILGWYEKAIPFVQQIDTAVSAFENYFDDQLQTYLRERHIDNLQKLLNFSFARHPLKNIDEDILIVFENILHQKVSMALSSFMQEKNVLQKNI